MKKIYILSIFIAALIFGCIVVIAFNQTKEEFKLCHPNEEIDWWGKSTYIYRNVDENHYNCCQYKTLLNDEGYYEETKICKGFIKRQT